ncbi:hypothetical protein KQX54_021721 [Cotesia glomerata]|uniref:Uncharacterized protein n=1 Tax=Cotesia glomerata TaxID=32391 RepID=A0AAV7J7H5_COTGL|nr:hypothetical protein KQX54_021721 [Cotesia glomerata]
MSLSGVRSSLIICGWQDRDGIEGIIMLGSRAESGIGSKKEDPGDPPPDRVREIKQQPREEGREPPWWLRNDRNRFSKSRISEL